MAYLSVQQDDANRSEAAKVEIEQVVRYGAKVGATPVISALFSEPQPEAEKIAALLALVEAVAISIVRLSKNGTSKFPVQLPVYTVAEAASVSPASYIGCAIYVSNGAAGQPVVAFSNGTNWLRVDTLAPIS